MPARSNDLHTLAPLGQPADRAVLVRSALSSLCVLVERVSLHLNLKEVPTSSQRANDLESNKSITPAGETRSTATVASGNLVIIFKERNIYTNGSRYCAVAASK